MLFRRAVRCAFTARRVATRRARPRGRVVKHVTRFYSGQDTHHVVDHGHDAHDAHGHHGHHDVAISIADRVPLAKQRTSSTEYLSQHFKYLTGEEVKNKLDSSWATQLMSNPAVLECFAEINTTEFKVPAPLTGIALQAKYQEQLANFENVRKPALESAGVSSRIIHHLHELYKVRSLVATWEINDAIRGFTFLEDDPQYRVTRGDIGPAPKWKLLKMQAFNLGVLSPEFEELDDTSNEEEQKLNVTRFRAVKAFIAAFERGLTDEEYAHVKEILAPAALTSDVEHKVHTAVSEIRALAKSDPEKAKVYIDQALNDFPPDSAARREFLIAIQQSSVALVPHSGSTAALSPDDGWSGTAAPSGSFKETWDANINEALKEEKDSTNKERLEKLKYAMDTMFDPETKNEWELIQLLQSAELTDDQQEELLSIFTDESDKESLLNDVLNPHPIAAQLWGDRMWVNSYEDVEYTQHFYEGEDTYFLPLERSSAKVKRFVRKHADVIAGSPPVHPPFNSATEEVVHMRLVRLAEEYYGFDLTSDLGLARFDLFLHNHDVSPGDDTLDRVHRYPPAHHTYEELPIIKFEGYEESDEPEHHGFPPAVDKAHPDTDAHAKHH